MKRYMWLAVLVSCVTGSAITSWAQDGVITGRISDSSDALLPGVSITLTSPGVMGERVSVSDERGTYRFTLLPPGVYALRFELPSFKTLVREGIQMSAGFTATLNAILEVATVQDTVTVVGESPQLNLETATVSTNFNVAVLEILPNPNDYNAVLAVMPGLQVITPDVGGGRSHIQQTVRSYGTSGQVWLMIDGVVTNQANAAYGPYYDTSSYAEFQVTQASKSAEIPTAGLNMNLIVKTGGNTVHGGAYADWIHSRFQGSNLTDELRRQGVNTANKRERFNEFHGDLGGPFIKDKFWWYSSTRYFYTGLYPYGFLKPDGITPEKYPTDVKSQTLKFNYQVTPNNTLTYMGFVQKKYQHVRAGIDEISYFDANSVAYQHYPGWAQKVQLTSVLSPRVTLEAKLAQFHLGQWKEFAKVQELSRRDLDTQQIRGGYSGGRTSIAPPFINDYRRWHLDGVLAVNTPGLGGIHNIRVGYGWLFDEYRLPKLSTYGDIVTEWRGGFMTPAFINTLDTPFQTLDRMRQHWLFVNDTWNVTRKLTINLGFRYDRYTPYLPEQGKTGTVGTYQEKFSVPRTVFPSLHSPVPRLSAIYDVSGTGRTALKLSYSKYGFNPASSISNMLNPVALTRKRYTWDGYLPPGWPANPWVPDPSKLVATFGGTNRTLDPNLKLPMYEEYTLGLDHQIRDITVRLSAVRKFERNGLQSLNEAIPYSAYDIPVTFTDPGRDNVRGTADDQQLTVFSLQPQYRGLSKLVLRNDPKVNTFVQYSLEAEKRVSSGWQVLGGFDILHFNSTGDIQNPNQAINAGDNYWAWQYKVIGSYELPKGIEVSGALRALKGQPRNRTINSPSLNQGVVSINAEPNGAFFYPSYALLDMQIEKSFRLGDSGQLSPMFIYNNILNNSAVTQASNVTGASFNRVAQIMDPRVFKLAVRYKF